MDDRHRSHGTDARAVSITARERDALWPLAIDDLGVIGAGADTVNIATRDDAPGDASSVRDYTDRLPAAVAIVDALGWTRRGDRDTYAVEIPADTLRRWRDEIDDTLGAFEQGAHTNPDLDARIVVDPPLAEGAR